MSALPPGISVACGIGEEERPVVRCKIAAITRPEGGRRWPQGDHAVPVCAAVVVTPAQARAWAAALLGAADRADGVITIAPAPPQGGRR